MNIKFLSALSLLLALSACQSGGTPENTGGSDGSQGSVQSGSPEPDQTVGTQTCTSGAAKEVVDSCLSEDVSVKQKVSRAIEQWAEHDGFWFPEMAKTGSFKKRFGLSELETQCLISKSCKE